MISVIIPMYQRAQYLDMCLGSVSMQTFTNLEIICVMDGFSQEIHDRLLCWKEKDPRIVMMCIEHQGPAAARNAGLAAAKGEYIAFLDADDVYPPQAMSILEKAMEDTGVDVVIGDYTELLDSGEKLPFFTPSGEKDDFNTCLESVTIWNRLYRKGVLEEKKIMFDERYRRADDRIFCMDLFLASPRVTVVHENVYWWYRHESDPVASITHKKKAEFFIQDIRMWNDFMDKMELRWYEHTHDHMRYSCQYILDCYHQVEDSPEKANAFMAFKQLVERIAWTGYETLFFNIFAMCTENFCMLDVL